MSANAPRCTRAKDGDAQDKLEKGATYLRLANARLRSGALIEPSEDNARFYLEAARQLMPEDDPALAETRARCRRRSSIAPRPPPAPATPRKPSAGWRTPMAPARRARKWPPFAARCKDTQIGARAGKMTALTQSFTNALAANRLLQPAGDNAKAHLLAMINIDGNHPAVASARQSLGNALLGEFRGALARNDLTAADTWLNEARTIGFSGNELKTAEGDLAAAREKTAQQPAWSARNRRNASNTWRRNFRPRRAIAACSGWVELEFTVLRRWLHRRHRRHQFEPAQDSSTPPPSTAVGQWRYKPLTRDGKPVEQRVAVRIRFSDQ